MYWTDGAADCTARLVAWGQNGTHAGELEPPPDRIALLTARSETMKAPAEAGAFLRAKGRSFRAPLAP